MMNISVEFWNSSKILEETGILRISIKLLKFLQLMEHIFKFEVLPGFFERVIFSTSIVFFRFYY